MVLFKNGSVSLKYCLVGLFQSPSILETQRARFEKAKIFTRSQGYIESDFLNPNQPGNDQRNPRRLGSSELHMVYRERVSQKA